MTGGIESTVECSQRLSYQVELFHTNTLEELEEEEEKEEEKEEEEEEGRMMIHDFKQDIIFI